MKRSELLAVSNLAASALASGDDVPKVLEDFCFTKKSILSYNDVIGIRLKNEVGVPFEGLAPGRLLLRFLKSCSADEAEFVDLEKNNSWRLQCGSSRLDFVVDGAEKFPFTFPSDQGAVLDLDEEFFTGLDLCASVVTERGLISWTAGIIVHVVGGKLTLGSTSGGRDSIHVYQVGNSFKSEFEGYVVAPISFCNAALDMRKHYLSEPVQLLLGDKYIVMKFGDWNAVFGRLIISDENVDLVDKSRELREALPTFVPITEKFRDGLGRAASMVGKEDTTDLVINENRLALRTQLLGGTLRDGVSLKEEHPEVKVQINPKRVALKLDKCDLFGVNQRLVGMESKDGRFLRLVANRA